MDGVVADKRWTPTEVAKLRDLYRQGWTATRMASEIGRTTSAVENKVHDLLATGLLVRELRTSPFQPELVRPVGHYAPPNGPTLGEIYAPEASAEETDTAFLERMVSQATRSIEKADAQRHAKLVLASDDAVAVSLTADWHVSAHGTDLASLIAYADYVAHTPGLYSLGIGDLTDNPIKHRGGSVQTVLDELRMLDLLIGRFRGKFLGTTSGNHDDWSKVFAGVDNLLALSKRHRIHYAPDELLWVIDVVHPVTRAVTATYRINTRHQWRRGSALNPAHACWTWLQEEGPNWDVIPDVLCIAHNHNAVVESRQFAARDIWALRPGTFQLDSSFARAKGFGRYRSTCPTVVLPAQQGRVQCFADPHDAITYMRGLTRAP